MSKRGVPSLLDQILRNRFQSSKNLARFLDEYREAAAATADKHHAARKKRVLRGVHKGRYYRVRLPPPRKPPPSISLPNLPKIPPPMSSQPPVAFKTAVVEASSSASTAAAGSSSSSSLLPPTDPTPLHAFRERLGRWWADNWSVVVLNFGSICTLAAFTRSDVLELRSLSVVGSACSVVYQLTLQPVRYVPILWSMMFAGVNSVKIYSILRERGSAVRLTGEQERIYVRHFMPHGITPKQFETVLGRARIRKYPKGATILKQGDKVERVYLVVRGATRATILGRRVSAASMPLVVEEDEGGSVDRGRHEAKASAWIGEMAFLEKYWIKEQLQVQRGSKKREIDEAVTETRNGTPSTPLDRSGDSSTAQPKRSSSKNGTSTSPGSRSSDPADELSRVMTGKGEVTLAPKRTIRPADASAASVPEAKADRSMYTITALEDCSVLEWTQEDMENLMERSTDLRAALTRALSSAIVGKVINFTLSKSQARRSWSQWLDDWKHSDGAKIHVQEQGGVEDEPLAPEALPIHPMKKFV